MLNDVELLVSFKKRWSGLTEVMLRALFELFRRFLRYWNVFMFILMITLVVLYVLRSERGPQVEEGQGSQTI